MENVRYNFLLTFIHCRCGNKRFEIHFRRIKPVYFLSKDANDATCEEQNAWKHVYFPPDLAPFFVDKIIKVLFATLFLDLACKQLCFPPRKGSIYEKQKY